MAKKKAPPVVAEVVAEISPEPPKLTPRVSPEGIVHSKCEYSPEGVLLRVLEA